jgi:predicted DNA-binding transcriptional regulator AlpA
MPTLERLITTREVAERLRVREQTVRLWRLTGRGPKYIRLSNSRVGYDPVDLDEWLSSRKARSSAEEKARRVAA